MDKEEVMLLGPIHNGHMVYSIQEFYRRYMHQTKEKRITRLKTMTNLCPSCLVGFGDNFQEG